MDHDAPTATNERRLTIVADELQAEMVRALLDSHGIACVVRRTAFGEIQWGAINVGMGGPREIIVAERDLAQSRALLEAETDIAPESTEVDHHLEERGRQLRFFFGFFVLFVFGPPLALFFHGVLSMWRL